MLNKFLVWSSSNRWRKYAMFWLTPEWNGLQLDGSKLQVSRANFGHHLVHRLSGGKPKTHQITREALQLTGYSTLVFKMFMILFEQPYPRE